MDGDNKLYLIEAILNETNKKLTFASYLKRDYIEKAVIINLSNDNIIERIFFSSNNFGTVEWKNGSGLGDCHKWENEDMAKKSSSLSRHYTAILSDGAETPDYARHLIIPDVLDSLADNQLVEVLNNTINSNLNSEKIDLKRFKKLAPGSEPV